MNPRTRHILLFTLALALIAGAVLIGFKDSLFPGPENTTSPETEAAIEDSRKAADPMPAPSPSSTEPQKPVFSKSARPMPGN